MLYLIPFLLCFRRFFLPFRHHGCMQEPCLPLCRLHFTYMRTHHPHSIPKQAICLIDSPPLAAYLQFFIVCCSYAYLSASCLYSQGYCSCDIANCILIFSLMFGACCTRSTYLHLYSLHLKIAYVNHHRQFSFPSHW